jgi:hypothetical protein
MCILNSVTKKCMTKKFQIATRWKNVLIIHHLSQFVQYGNEEIRRTSLVFFTLSCVWQESCFLNLILNFVQYVYSCTDQFYARLEAALRWLCFFFEICRSASFFFFFFSFFFALLNDVL